jgi:hypothetical protein
VRLLEGIQYRDESVCIEMHGNIPQPVKQFPSAAEPESSVQ